MSKFLDANTEVYMRRASSKTTGAPSIVFTSCATSGPVSAACSHFNMDESLLGALFQTMLYSPRRF